MIAKISLIAASFLVCSGLAMAQTTTQGSQVPKSNGAAQPTGIQDQPKVYQPQNPAPDTRSSPTSSSAGVGSDSGGRPEEQKKQ